MRFGLDTDLGALCILHGCSSGGLIIGMVQFNFYNREHLLLSKNE